MPQNEYVAEEELDDDPFHIASHPVYGAKDGSGDGKADLPDKVFVQAYEADLIPDSEASAANRRRVQWQGHDCRESPISIVTDAYDAIHLLGKLPAGAALIDSGHSSPKGSPEDSLPVPASPQSGMSDLPSDAEDVFFMRSEDEASAYFRKKQMAQMERRRLARIEAITEQQEQEQQIDKDLLPGSAPLITQDQLDLMRKTATALRNAANPSQLEMRIWAHHGNDERFAFLRRQRSGEEGAARLFDVWVRVKRGDDISLETANNVNGEQPEQAVGGSSEAKTQVGLIAYDSSNSSSDAGSDEERPVETRVQISTDVKTTAQDKKRKLELAKEWSRKRRERLEAEKETQEKPNGNLL